MPDRYFTKQTISFLSSLANNNTRAWFEEHKQEHENFVREPALDFIVPSAVFLRKPFEPGPFNSLKAQYIC